MYVAVAVPAGDAGRARVARRILQSISRTTVDRYGCRDRAAPLTTSSNPPSRELVPGRPTSAVACEYAPGHRLIGSGPLTVSQLATVQGVFDAGRSVSGELKRLSPVTVRYVFAYPDGSRRVVEASVDQDPVIANDGRRAVSTEYDDLPRAYR